MRRLSRQLPQLKLIPTLILGGGLIKQRVARPGRGKSSGYRTIVAFRGGNLAFSVFGFAKSDRGNISTVEERALRKLAANLLTAPEAQRASLLRLGEIIEV